MPKSFVNFHCFVIRLYSIPAIEFVFNPARSKTIANSEGCRNLFASCVPAGTIFARRSAKTIAPKTPLRDFDIVDTNTNPSSLTNFLNALANTLGSVTCSITSKAHTTSNEFGSFSPKSSAVSQIYLTLVPHLSSSSSSNCDSFCLLFAASTFSFPASNPTTSAPSLDKLSLSNPPPHPTSTILKPDNGLLPFLSSSFLLKCSKHSSLINEHLVGFIECKGPNGPSRSLHHNSASCSNFFVSRESTVVVVFCVLRRATMSPVAKDLGEQAALLFPLIVSENGERREESPRAFATGDVWVDIKIALVAPRRPRERDTTPIVIIIIIIIIF
mmetsp:Transcript_7858/g.23319  ORF Transcript_7858/g.23319 Transcript_7858/m.23319 type:complete len:329 (+) Transcript_7858:389-1375(+)